MAADRVVLFDLDGTLVDSAPDIAAALDLALRQQGRAPIGEARTRDCIGNGAARLVHRALTATRDGDAEPALFEAVYSGFLSAYAAALCVRTRVYPGVLTALDGLAAAGWALAVVTNKPHRFSVPLLKAVGLAGYFGCVLSGDSLAQRKPHPAPLLEAAARFDLVPAAAVMVGDSQADVDAARAAGMRVVCVSYGYSDQSPASELGADAVLDTLAELPATLDALGFA